MLIKRILGHDDDICYLITILKTLMTCDQLEGNIMLKDWECGHYLWLLCTFIYGCLRTIIYGCYGPLSMVAMDLYLWLLWTSIYGCYGPLSMVAMDHYLWLLWTIIYGCYGPLSKDAIDHCLWLLWPLSLSRQSTFLLITAFC